MMIYSVWRRMNQSKNRIIRCCCLIFVYYLFFLLGFFVTNHGMEGEKKINSFKFRFRSIENAQNGPCTQESCKQM